MLASGLSGRMHTEYCPGGAGKAKEPLESGLNDVSFSSSWKFRLHPRRVWLLKIRLLQYLIGHLHRYQPKLYPELSGRSVWNKNRGRTRFFNP